MLSERYLKMKRFRFECVIRDLRKESLLRVKSLIIFNDRNECYFETLTVRVERPKIEEIKIIEEDFDAEEKAENLYEMSKVLNYGKKNQTGETTTTT